MALIEAPEHSLFVHEHRRYLRAPKAVHFPSEECVPETKRHLEVRTTLYLLLKDTFAAKAAIGSEQFVYWDVRNPRKCLSPDVFVKLGAKNDTFDIWKGWERGAPDLAVEIVSDSDRDESDWDEKVERYQASGIGEVVRFDPENEALPLRIWDRIEGDLVEREPDSTHHRECVALGLWWVVVPSNEGPILRLARDRSGEQLLPTPDEERVRLADELAKERKARSAAEHMRMLAEHASALAEQRLREEAEARERAERERDTAAAERDAAAAENERLKAELARLRGEQG